MSKQVVTVEMVREPREVFMQAVPAEFNNGKVTWDEAWNNCATSTHKSIYDQWMAKVANPLHSHVRRAELTNNGQDLATKQGVAAVSGLIEHGSFEPQRRHGAGRQVDAAAETASVQKAYQALNSPGWREPIKAMQDEVTGHNASLIFVEVCKKFQEEKGLSWDDAFAKGMREFKTLYQGMSVGPKSRY